MEREIYVLLNAFDRPKSSSWGSDSVKHNQLWRKYCDDSAADECGRTNPEKFLCVHPLHYAKTCDDFEDELRSICRDRFQREKDVFDEKACRRWTRDIGK